MRFSFWGSSNFAKTVLQGLLQNRLKPVCVITTPPRPQGRKKIITPTPVHQTALKNKIPVLSPSRLLEETFLEKLEKYKPEIALLTGYGKIIPSQLIHFFPQGFLNLHPSLLPRWRGATPIQSTILAGDTQAGVTLFLLDEKIDHGPIVAVKKININNKRYTYPQLSQCLAQLAIGLIIETLPQWLRKEIRPVPQNESLATYCYKITRSDERINWNQDADYIDRKVRALNPNPGTYTIASERIIKIIQGQNFPDNPQTAAKKPGETFIVNSNLAVKCGKGYYVISQLKPAGKKTMSSSDFIKGNSWILNQVLQ